MSAGVTRELRISWAGQEVVVHPSNRLLRRIEAEVKLLPFLEAAAQGRVAVSELAFIVATCLQSAGVKITEDEMLSNLMGAGRDRVMETATALLAALLPADPAGKGPADPA